MKTSQVISHVKVDLVVGYLFSDAFRFADYVAPNGGTNDEIEKIWKEVDVV
jgi:hypothetical protein